MKFEIEITEEKAASRDDGPQDKDYFRAVVTDLAIKERIALHSPGFSSAPDDRGWALATFYYLLDELLKSRQFPQDVFITDREETSDGGIVFKVDINGVAL